MSCRERPRYGNLVYRTAPAMNGHVAGVDPVIYEINTAVWLHDVGARREGRHARRRTGRRVGRASTPAGVDAVWLMGVWERSPAGVALALDVARRTSPSFRATLARPRPTTT